MLFPQTCHVCNSKFLSTNSKKTNRKCSKECMNAARRAKRAKTGTDIVDSIQERIFNVPSHTDEYTPTSSSTHNEPLPASIDSILPEFTRRSTKMTYDTLSESPIVTLSCPHLSAILNDVMEEIKHVRDIYPNLDTMSIYDIKVPPFKSAYGFAELSWSKLVEMAPYNKSGYPYVPFLECVLNAKLVLRASRGYQEMMPRIISPPQWSPGNPNFWNQPAEHLHPPVLSFNVMFGFDPKNPVLSEYQIYIRQMLPTMLHLFDKITFSRLFEREHVNYIREVKKNEHRYQFSWGRRFSHYMILKLYGFGFIIKRLMKWISQLDLI